VTTIIPLIRAWPIPQSKVQETSFPPTQSATKTASCRNPGYAVWSTDLAWMQKPWPAPTASKCTCPVSP